MIDVAYCDGSAALADILGEPDRVAVIGDTPEFVAASRAVGMAGWVVGICAGEPVRAAAERERRRWGLYRLELVVGRGARLPAADGSIDAVVLAAPAAMSQPRGALLREIGRILRPRGRVIVVNGWSSRGPGLPAAAGAGAIAT